MTTYEKLRVYAAFATAGIAIAAILASTLSAELRSALLTLRAHAVWLVIVRRRFLMLALLALSTCVAVATGMIMSNDEAERLPLTPHTPIRAVVLAQTSNAKRSSDATRLVKSVRFIKIPAGTNGLGCCVDDHECERNEPPIHPVTISQPFWMTATEVTVGQYHACVRRRECSPSADHTFPHEGVDTLPMTWIDFEEARRFCRSLGGDLPTETQWEYAARGGLGNNRYPWGQSIEREQARFRTAAPEGVATVGSFKPNGFGLFDMSGNVAEWCIGPPASDGRPFAVLRGGSYKTGIDRLRVSARTITGRDHFSEAIGFRCVLN